jgi:exodeoxyribonuclease VII large subunit
MLVYDFENSQDPLTVAEFITLLNSRITSIKTGVIGEVSEMKMSAKGHAYPVIKDKETGDILPCTMWASDYVLNGIELETGLEILANGHPEFYGPFGKLSFHIKSFQLVGEGQLKKAYEKLKKKLSAEGVFDKERKKELPNFPKNIGVITSIHGEVIHDFSNNLRKSGFKVKILHSPVEGPESGRHLTLAVRHFRKEEIDILVIMRGGGSMQSLAGFDNEALVREIISFPKPTVAGIGHHQDVPLVALVADISESTPSMVASIINSSWEKADLKLNEYEESIFSRYQNELKKQSDLILYTFNLTEEIMNSIFKKFKESEHELYLSLKIFEQKLKDIKEFLVNEITVSKKQLSNFIKISSDKLLNSHRFIRTNSPEKQLSLGYSLVFSKGKIVKSKKNLRTGQEINVKVNDGNIVSEIKKIK